MSINNSTFNLPNWSSIISDVSIPSTIAVYGNGKAIGLTDGTNNGGGVTGDAYRPLKPSISAYNLNIGSDNTAAEFPQHKVIGITSDTSGKSGIVAKSNSITKTSKSFKFCIKY